MNKLFCQLFLLIFLVIGPSPASAEHDISPVYEEMLANQTFSLWKGLIAKGKVNGKEPFFVVGVGEEKDDLASRIVAGLERNHPEAVSWELGSLSKWKEGEPFRGVILMTFDTPRDFEAASLFIGKPENNGFILLFSNQYMNRTWLESNIEDTGLKVRTVVLERELEFVEDELGRQIVDLDDPKWRGMIYERLVHDGMNPIRAHSATDEAILKFRVSNESKIIIVGKD